jgi:hypothetical protein
VGLFRRLEVGVKDNHQTKLNVIIVITLGVFVTSLLVLFLVLNIRQQLVQIQQNPALQGASINGESQGKESKDPPPESTEEEDTKLGAQELREEDFEKLLEEHNRREEELRKIKERLEKEIEKRKNSLTQP